MAWKVVLHILLSAVFVQFVSNATVEKYLISSDSEELFHLEINGNNSQLYVSATNKLFIRDANLEPVKTLILGPRNDSSSCRADPATPCDCPDVSCTDRQPTNCINKALLWYKNFIVMCNNLFYGSCIKINTADLTVHDFYTPVVGPWLGLKTAVYSFNDKLYVANEQPANDQMIGTNTFEADEVFPISSRKMSDFTLSLIGESSTSKLSFLVDYSYSFHVKYEYMFKYHEHIYFVISRPNLNNPPGNGTFLGRICADDDEFESYAEVELLAAWNNLQGNVGAAFFSSEVGVQTRAKIGIATGDSVLMAVFNIVVAGRGSVRDYVCIYSMEKITSFFKKYTDLCYNGQGRTGPDYLVSPTDCHPATDHNGQSPSSPCTNQDAHYSRLFFSDEKLPFVKQYRLMDGTDVQSLVGGMIVKVTPDHRETVFYMTTTDGKFLKGKVETADSLEIFDELELDLHAFVKSDLKFDKNQEYLYALSSKNLFYVKLYDCASYLTCDSCLSAKDPHCGWCTFEKRCTTAAECSKYSNFPNMGWYYGTTCHQISQITPTQESVFNLNKRQITLTVTGAPVPVEFRGSLLCQLTVLQDTYDSAAEFTDTSIICQEFMEDIRLPQGLDMYDTPLDVVVADTGNLWPWLESSIVLYHCQHFNSCSSCVGGQQACSWCLKTSRCSNNQVDCGTDRIDSDGLVQLPVSAMSRCPRFESVGDTSVAENGAKMFHFKGLEIQNYQQANLQCVFTVGTADPLVIHAMVLSAPGSEGSVWDISCSEVQLSRSVLNAPEQNVTIDLYWDYGKHYKLDNPNNVKVLVYSCNDLAQSCGQCTALPSSYSCQWCDGSSSCTVSDLSCSGPSFQAGDKDALCPNPEILQFSPVAGPTQGDTNVTIIGKNFPLNQAYVTKVTVGHYVCTTKLYKPPDLLVCATSTVSRAISGPIAITIAKGDTEYIVKPPKDSYTFVDMVAALDAAYGPIAGGTEITVRGSNLNIGSRIDASINRKPCNITRRSATEMVLITPAQDIPGVFNLKLVLEGRTEQNVPSFTYRNNPVMSAINSTALLRSAGTNVTLMGSGLNFTKNSNMTLYTAGQTLTVVCTPLDATLLNCLVPSLAQFKLVHLPTSLTYSFQMDGWFANRTDLLKDLDKSFPLIMVHEDPVVSGLVPPEIGGITWTIKGSGFHVLTEITGFQVLVGDTSATIVAIQPTTVSFEKPPQPAIIAANGTSLVFIKLGNLVMYVGTIRYRESQSKNRLGFIIGVFFGVAIPLIIVLAIVLCCILKRGKKKQKKRPEIYIKKENTYVEKGKGNETAAESLPLKDYDDNNHALNHSLSASGGANKANNSGGEEEETELANGPLKLADLLDNIKDDTLRESVKEVLIPIDRLEIRQPPIGKGNFGDVYAATLKGTETTNNCRVAVKTLHGGRINQHSIEAFLKEGVIMKRFDHQHILTLLGVCINENQYPMVVLPYMANGDLRTFVKDKKRNFTARQLLQMAQQVAEGMAYLHSLNFIHRDLAARNCMIDELETVKVADFGLTRDLFEKQYYSTNLKEKGGKMPIKWMALESLELFVFTVKSDVWSFGVLMWELMTRGVTPYPDVDIFDVRNYLADGRRLRKPKYCPENIYKIMMDCWHTEPDRRPSFTDLVNRIEFLLNPTRTTGAKEAGDGVIMEGDPMYMNIKNASTPGYLQPVDGNALPPASTGYLRPIDGNLLPPATANAGYLRPVDGNLLPPAKE